MGNKAPQWIPSVLQLQCFLVLKSGAYCLCRVQALYDLFAVDNHSGSMSFGHYTAYVKHPVTGQWLDCNGV